MPNVTETFHGRCLFYWFCYEKLKYFILTSFKFGTISIYEFIFFNINFLFFSIFLFFCGRYLGFSDLRPQAFIYLRVNTITPKPFNIFIPNVTKASRGSIGNCNLMILLYENLKLFILTCFPTQFDSKSLHVFRGPRLLPVNCDFVKCSFVYLCNLHVRQWDNWV